MSFNFYSGEPVNKRVDPKCPTLPILVYGHALRRFVHRIVDARQRYPTTPIVLAKADFKSAYRRLHQQLAHAFQQIVTTRDLTDNPGEQVALAALRLTFGGSLNPRLWCEVSELLTDLINAIITCTPWRPNSTTGFPQPSYGHLIGPPPADLHSTEPPFAPARPLAVDLPLVPGQADCYVDDIFSMWVCHQGSEPDHAIKATFLAMEILGRPNTDQETLVRDDLLSIGKAKAEATPSERLIVLGWLLDTRHLTIALPQDKASAWRGDIESILKQKASQHHTLETLLGRLTNISTILRPARHFLSRLRYATERASLAKNQLTGLKEDERLDLELWLHYIARAETGIDLNLVTARLPDHIFKTDACLYQLGGYSVGTGRAWRLPLPAEFDRHQVSINFLEFLAAHIAVVLAREEGEIAPGDCVLSVTDNTSADKWLHQTNFAEFSHPAHLRLARQVASHQLLHSYALYCQWTPGDTNLVADILSRNRTFSDAALTDVICHYFPRQVTNQFQIRPLPEHIISMAFSLVRLAQRGTESPKPPPPDTNSPGNVGSNSSSAAASTTMPSWMNLTQPEEIASSALLPKQREKGISLNPLRDAQTWLRQHAKPPCPMWLRPSFPLADPTPGTAPTDDPLEFYNDNSAATKTPMPLPNNKKRSHSPYWPR
jgi:hypothetical protein